MGFIDPTSVEGNYEEKLAIFRKSSSSSLKEEFRFKKEVI